MSVHSSTPFALSLSKGNLANPYFDKLSTDGVYGFLSDFRRKL
jgi:hypothetical protein